MERPTNIQLATGQVINRDDVARKLAGAASLIKLVTGVGNNCALSLMRHALTQISGKAVDTKRSTEERTVYKPAHPAYRQHVKRLYQQAVKESHDYERNLLYTHENRFFCVRDMSKATRKIYGDITDQQYFEFWKGMAGPAYSDTQPLINSLWNKYRVSLVAHRIRHPEQLAWALTATSGLQIAITLYDAAIHDCICEQKIPAVIVRNVFAGFSLARVLTAWTAAMKATDPTAIYPLDPVEDRNIELGIRQLQEAWVSPTTMYQSCMDAIPDFDDIFRTKGEMKKAMREIKEVEEETDLELRKE